MKERRIIEGTFKEHINSVKEFIRKWQKIAPYGSQKWLELTGINNFKYGGSNMTFKDFIKNCCLPDGYEWHTPKDIDDIAEGYGIAIINPSDDPEFKVFEDGHTVTWGDNEPVTLSDCPYQYAYVLVKIISNYPFRALPHSPTIYVDYDDALNELKEVIKDEIG